MKYSGAHSPIIEGRTFWEQLVIGTSGLPMMVTALRPWQEYFIKEASKAFEKGFKVVAVEAPTGSGKTLIALKVIDKILKGGLATKSYFLVRTSAQLLAPFRDIEKFKIDLKASPLVGKDKACPLGSMPINACPSCPWRDRLAPLPSSWTHLFDWIKNSINSMTCPYTTLKFLSETSELVVMVYSYLVPHVAERLGLDVSNALLVFDEAHHVLKLISEKSISIDFAISVLSSTPQLVKALKRSTLSEYANDIAFFGDAISRTMGVLKQLLNIGYLKKPIRVSKYTKELPVELKELKEIVEELTKEAVKRMDPVLDRLVKYLNVLDVLVSASEKTSYIENEKLVVRSLRPWLRDYLDKISGALLISATMPSKEILEKLLGVEVVRISLFNNAYALNEYTRVFKPEKILNIFINDYTSSYKLRTNKINIMKRSIIERAVFEMIKRKGGLGLIVYPSFAMLNIAKMTLLEHSEETGVPVIIEERGGGVIAVEKAKREEFAVLAAVAGDQITEGVEITNGEGRSRIRVVAIVGAPYPPPTPFYEDMASSLDPKNANDILNKLYVEEMLIKVRQASGRLKRHPDDEGVIIFADKRLLEFTNVLAPFGNVKIMSSETLLERVRELA